MVVDLPEPFGPEEAGHLARLHVEAEVVDRHHRAETLGEAESLDHRPRP